MAELSETRKNLRDIILKSQMMKPHEFAEIHQKHMDFLQKGGAGGYWATYYIKNLIFGIYKNDQEIEGQAKLSFHNLADLTLQNVVLPYANCASVLAEKTDWEGADLEGSLFIDAIMNEASFRDADLYAADFSRAELRKANFQGANLIKTDFENCDLTGADLRNANIDDSTSFKNAIMDNVLRD